MPPRDGATQLDYDKAAFYRNWPIDRGGLPRLQHFKNICDALWTGKDAIEWNPWLEAQIEAFCNNKWVAFPGCAGGGKTFSASLWAMVYWMMAPHKTSVILTSTTKGMIRKRAWAIIQRLWTTLPPWAKGEINMVDSKTTLQARKGDDKNAIFAIAVAEGSTAKAVANIQGVHTERQVVIIDEATDTPEAAFEACANLFNSPKEFQLIVMGNPASHFDPMGKFCEPKGGWMSVNVETEEWETLPQLDGKSGVVVRFDAEKSPNVKAGKVLYPYLVTEAQLKGSRIKYGSKSPLFWKFQRGFWAPDGMKETVFNETLLAQMNGMGRFTFIGQKMKHLATLDPAFGGGDRAVFTHGKLGDVTSSMMGVELVEQIELEIDASSPTDIHYQLARQVIDLCRKKGIRKREFGILVAGEGGGTADIIDREWKEEGGGKIIRIEEGGSASKTPISKEDPRLASEVYERKNVEIWHMGRQYLMAGQLRGITPTVALQMCNRELDYSHKKIKMQTKQEMKESFQRSPDHADSYLAMLEVARWHGFVLVAIGTTILIAEEWDKSVEAANEVYAAADYSETGVEDEVNDDWELEAA